jgi:hypothetical protein
MRLIDGMAAAGVLLLAGAAHATPVTYTGKGANSGR